MVQLEAAWQRCRDMQAADEAVNSVVLSVNRGGLLVEVEHLRGFVPQSHIAIRSTAGAYPRSLSAQLELSYPRSLSAQLELSLCPT